MPYYHVVFTLPAPIADIAYTNKAVIYDALFKAASETLLRIAADPKHLGAKIGVTMVLHTWGSALTHHPHVHCIVPGGGLSPDGQRWISCKPGFFLPVRVLSRLFRRLMLQRLVAAHAKGALQFFGDHAALHDANAFSAFLKPLRRVEWVVYAKRPFAGPDQVLSYLARYTHRVAIANSRLVAFDGARVSFKWKDYRRQGEARYGVMTLDAHEFIRRFLLHVLPDGFHRIRHYGLFANATRADNLAKARALLADATPTQTAAPEPRTSMTCPCCGGPMILIEVFERGAAPRIWSCSPSRRDSTAHDQAPSNRPPYVARRAQQTCNETPFVRKPTVAAQALTDRGIVASTACVSALPQAPLYLGGTRNVRCTVTLAQGAELKSP